jgi:heme exporter protein D
MAFTSFQQFLHMGGYAAYVWPAYAVTFTVLIINIVIPCLRTRNLRRTFLRNKKSYK